MIMLISRKHTYKDCYQMLRVVHCKVPEDALPIIQTYANLYKAPFYLSDAGFTDFECITPEKRKKTCHTIQQTPNLL